MCGRLLFLAVLGSHTVRPPDRQIADYSKEIVWNGVLFPQPPNYIFVVYQKDPTFTTYNNPLEGIDTVAAPAGANYAPKFGVAAAARTIFDNAAHTNEAVRTHVGTGADVRNSHNQAGAFNQELAARNVAMAQDSNAAILQFECVIQSAVGSFAFRDSAKPYLQDRDRLWRTHVRNCHKKYIPAGRAAWQDRESCLLLSSSDYLIGLETSSGTVFPITLDLRVKFGNRAAYSGGVCFTTGMGVKGKMTFEDIMIGEPTLVGCFHQNVMSIAASSSVLSAQAFSQATTAAALQSS